MVTQYPHTAVFTIPKTASQDADGNWITAGSEEVKQYNCRMELAGGGNNIRTAYIIGSDGARIDVSAIAYLPLPVDEIKAGTKVQITRDGIVVKDSTVKQFSKGYFNARVWL